MCFLNAGYDAAVKDRVTAVTMIAIVRVRPWPRRIEMPVHIVAISKKPKRPDDEITTSASNINIPDIASSARAD